MSEESGVLGFVYVAIGLLVIGLSVPLLRGKVGMNRWYGVRLPKSYTSEANWLAMNRYGARQMLWFAGALILIGVVAILLPPRPGSLWFVGLLAAPALLTVPMLVLLLRFANRLPWDGGA